MSLARALRQKVNDNTIQYRSNLEAFMSKCFEDISDAIDAYEGYGEDLEVFLDFDEFNLTKIHYEAAIQDIIKKNKLYASWDYNNSKDGITLMIKVKESLKNEEEPY
jgi:hypothetical protein